MIIDTLFKAVYAGAVIRHFGPQTLKDRVAIYGDFFQRGHERGTRWFAGYHKEPEAADEREGVSREKRYEICQKAPSAPTNAFRLCATGKLQVALRKTEKPRRPRVGQRQGGNIGKSNRNLKAKKPSASFLRSRHFCPYTVELSSNHKLPHQPSIGVKNLNSCLQCTPHPWLPDARRSFCNAVQVLIMTKPSWSTAAVNSVVL